MALKPKGDLALLYALAHCILRDGRVDAGSLARTGGLTPFAEFLNDYSPVAMAEKTGLTVEMIETLAFTVSEPGKRVSWWWTMGVNQSHEGVRTAQAIINLCLMRGNIGKPGTGPNSITGQCNAMGSRLFSNTTSLVGGHDFTDAAHRAKVADLLEIPVECIPAENSAAYEEILAAAEAGTIKGLWDRGDQSVSLMDRFGALGGAVREARFPGGSGHVSQHRKRAGRRPVSTGSRMG